MDVFEVLARDHRELENTFRRIQGARDVEERTQLFATLQRELSIHMQVEEEIFYPALNDGSQVGERVHEAAREHAEAKRLLDRVDQEAVGSPVWNAQFESLVEAVSHHLSEEETRLFPEARRLLSTRMQEDLYQRISARKQALRAGNGESAQDRAAHVAREGTRQAASWMSEQGREAAEFARQRGGEMFAQTSQAAAGYAHDLADALRETADSLERRGKTPLAGYLSRAAEGLEHVSSDFDQQDLQRRLRQAGDYTRRHPAAVFGGAIAAGFVLSRLLKSSSARADPAGAPSTPGGGDAPHHEQSAPGNGGPRHHEQQEEIR